MNNKKSIQRWLMVVFVLLGTIELASRYLFGNFAQSALVQRDDDPDLCMTLGVDRDLSYTGWYRRVAETRMESDEYGSRGFSTEKVQTAKKVFMLGDSFTYGQGVNLEDALPALVDSRLGDAVQIWNFGVPGRHFYQMPSEIERLSSLQPDLILVNLFINDFHEPPGHCMLGTQTDWMLPLMRSCHLCRWVILGLTSPPEPLSVEEIETEIESTIREIEAQSTRFSIPIVFVLLMDHYAYQEFRPKIPAVHEIVHQTATHWLDLNSVWSQLLLEEEVYQIPGEYHWNVEGNHLLAKDYAAQLQSRVLILIQ